MIGHTIGAALDQACAHWSANLAIVSRHQSVRWTWGELADEVDRVATGLLRLGVMPGDRVGIGSPNCVEWTVLQLATARLGIALVNINPAYRIAEVAYALNKVGCSVLVVAPSFKSSDYIGMMRELMPGRVPQLRCCITLGTNEHDGFLPWSALLEQPDRDQLSRIAASLDPDQPINIQFTSGTTGSHKGAVLTHRNILNNGFFVGRQLGLQPDDRVCIPVPLYHCFGMVMGDLACLNHGAAMVYPAASFDPPSVLEAIAAERCTALYGVPTMLIAVLNHPDFASVDLTSLRTGIMAGSPCPEATMREVIDRMHMQEVTIAYGMTETSPVSTQTDRDDPLDERVTTVGRVQPHLELSIVGSDNLPVPRGATGELCVRGYSVMQGYWQEPLRTAEAIDADGWMHTGDLGSIDAAGYVRITGRIKDMIIRGGENIYPREIEEHLLRQPDIADVQVFGVTDRTYGEEVCAWVIPRPGSSLTPAAIEAHCRGQIAHYKVPRYIRVVDSFVTTVTGKPQKFEMRKLMEHELGEA